MLPSDFHFKKNDGTTGAAHLIQTFVAISPDIMRARSLANHRSLVFRQKKYKSSVLLQSFRHFPYNENLMRALNTMSLKCCLPSTDAIDRLEKNLCMHMKVQSRFMQVYFIEIHQVSAKKINKRSDTFLT